MIRIAGGVLAAALFASSVAAQPRILLQGTLDAEGWATDTGSTMLTRNGGKPAGLARLQLWGAAELGRGLVAYALAEAERATDVDAVEAELEMAGVRLATGRFVLDAGKITGPLGGFAARRFSWRNPLIGEPDGYPTVYPHGAMVTGSFGWLDTRVAAISLPPWHEGYTPEPTPILRPALSVGITPTIGVRVGASATWGPYLNDRLSAAQLAGQNWRSYHQRMLAVEVAAAVGYLELHAEAGASRYDVPGQGDISGITYYGEAKYTFHPRVFAAARAERNDYPFIRPLASGNWVARRTDFSNAEMGVGYRLRAETLLKASYRLDRWEVTDANRAFIRPGGHAFAVQLSQRFDVMSWIEAARR